MSSIWFWRFMCLMFASAFVMNLFVTYGPDANYLADTIQIGSGFAAFISGLIVLIVKQSNRQNPSP